MHLGFELCANIDYAERPAKANRTIGSSQPILQKTAANQSVQVTLTKAIAPERAANEFAQDYWQPTSATRLSNQGVQGCLVNQALCRLCLHTYPKVCLHSATMGQALWNTTPLSSKMLEFKKNSCTSFLFFGRQFGQYMRCWGQMIPKVSAAGFWSALVKLKVASII